MARKLIVSDYGRLETVFGATGAQDIDSKLKGLVDADLKCGIESQVLYCDKGFGSVPGHSLKFPAHPDFSPDQRNEVWKVSQAEVNEYCFALKALIGKKYTKSKFDYLLIVGGNKIIPLFRATNPISHITKEESDRNVPTDNPYGCPRLRTKLVEKYLLPDLPVGRLPDDNSGDAKFLLKLIDFAIAELNREAAGEVLTKINGMAYSALVWASLTKSVAQNAGIDIKTSYEQCPPERITTFPVANYKDRELYYFNLHGGLGTGVWYGQDGDNYPEAFGPALVGKLKPRQGAVAATEACYGGDIISRSAVTSSALAFLFNHCAGVIGSSTIAYGNSEPPNSCADTIAQVFMTKVQGGQSTGESLLLAKQELAKQRRSPTVKKTLLQFSLLGDPSLHPMQKRLKSFLSGIDQRRELAESDSTYLRKYLEPLEAREVPPDARNLDLSEDAPKFVSMPSVPAGLSEAKLAGVLKETYREVSRVGEIFERYGKALAESVGDEPERKIHAVHRFFVGKQPVIEGIELPPRFHVQSLYYRDGRQVEEVVVSSR